MVTDSIGKTPFVKAEDCFNEKIFNCKTPKTCIINRKKYRDTYTNIMALPYLIGDCREISWFTGFLCNIINTNKSISYRICYSTLYSVIETTKSIYRVMDHVFVIECKNNRYTVIDPMTMVKQNNCIILHDEKLSTLYNDGSIIPSVVNFPSYVNISNKV